MTDNNAQNEGHAASYKEIVTQKGALLFTPGGNSMRPMLKHHETPIYVVAMKNGNSLKKYDVPFYVRDNGQCVLHRIVGEKDGMFVCCGDGQVGLEYGVRKDMVFARLVGFYRGEKYIEVDKSVAYKIYSRIWVAIRPLRRVYAALKNRIKRIIFKKD